MRVVYLGGFLIAATVLAGCGSSQPSRTPEAFKTAWRTDPQFRRAAIARCVEKTKTMYAETMREVRQIMRAKSNAEAAPVFCERLNDALIEGRLDASELSWTNGISTQSPRLIRALQGR